MFCYSVSKFIFNNTNVGLYFKILWEYMIR